MQKTVGALGPAVLPHERMRKADSCVMFAREGSMWCVL